MTSLLMLEASLFLSSFPRIYLLVVSKNPLRVLKNLMILGLERMSGKISKSVQNLLNPSKFIK